MKSALVPILALSLVLVACGQGPDLFEDVSDDVKEYIGGYTMPEGTYDFTGGRDCGVSIRRPSSPEYANVSGGDHTRRIVTGDRVIILDCKVYGPK